MGKNVREWTADRIIGLNLHDLRRAAGLSQKDVASDMAAAGFKWERDTVAQIETGRRKVALDELVGLAAYFDLPVRALVSNPFRIVESVTFGEKSVPLTTWSALWRDWDSGSEPVPAKEDGRKPSHRAAIDQVFKGVSRPWARIWRKRGGEPGEAFAEARESRLTTKAKYPGPIFLAGGDRPGSEDKSYKDKIFLPPWAVTVPIEVRPDEPYVARDEVEADHLEQAEGQGHIRRIPRHIAHYMRQKRKGSK